MILLVEDDPDDEALMVRALEQGTVGPFIVARDGAEALAYLLTPGAEARPVPELVLLDMNLPRVKGLDVLRQIRASPRTRHVPVVILTSSGHADDVTRSYELGANSFVGKPADPGRFTEAIREIARYWLRLNRVAVARRCEDCEVSHADP
jgi:two-component system response regulator